jgi:hypothetical protein
MASCTVPAGQMEIALHPWDAPPTAPILPFPHPSACVLIPRRPRGKKEPS